MKFKLSIFICSCLAICSFGQISIKGKIKDRQQGLQFATVLLLGQDSSLVKGVVTNNAGEFIIENISQGHYLISSSMIGYAKYVSEPLLAEDKNITLPDIFLEEAPTELSEVVVKSERPLFEQRTDRLVVNIQSSITSSGNTILELLQKSPGVVVNKQNNTISMNGKSGVRVMINDKIMQLPLDVVVQMLDGMNSSNVDRIELITTPPSKYDAEGNAGIIHIVMKENLDFGTSGSYGLTLGAHWAETLGGNLTINHRREKFSLFLDYSILRNHNLHTLHSSRESIGNELPSVSDDSHRENVTTQQNLSAGLEWKLERNTLLNFLLTAYRRNWELEALTNDVNQLTSGTRIITDMNIRESNIWQSASGSMGLQRKINTKSGISFNIDYLYYHNNNPSRYDNKLLYEQDNVIENQKIDLQKSTPIQFFIAKADYQHSVSPSFEWEAGMKGVTSYLDNDILVQRLVNNVWTVDPAFTSYSTLREQIGAAYISAKWQMQKQWKMNGGLRYEYTHTSISSPTQLDIINRKYGYLFPSLLIQKDISNERDIQLSYTRRVTRPTYNDIAPYVFFWGPNTFSAGNTTLFPSISDAIKVGYHVNQWIVSLQFSHSVNEIANLQPDLDSQLKNLTYRSQNLKYLNTIGLTNSYSFTPASWWEIQSNMVVLYQVGETSHLVKNIMLSLYGLNLNVINTLKLPKDFAVEVSGVYQSSTLSGITVYLPQGSLNAGIQKKLGDKGTIRLSMDDILNTNNWRIKTDQPENNLNANFNYNWHNQFIRLTYTRNFGNSKLRSVKLKSGSEEERKRIN